MRHNPYEIARDLGRRSARKGRSAQSCPYSSPGYARAWLDGRRRERIAMKANRKGSGTKGG